MFKASLPLILRIQKSYRRKQPKTIYKALFAYYFFFQRQQTKAAGRKEGTVVEGKKHGISAPQHMAVFKFRIGCAEKIVRNVSRARAPTYGRWWRKKKTFFTHQTP